MVKASSKLSLEERERKFRMNNMRLLKTTATTTTTIRTSVKQPRWSRPSNNNYNIEKRFYDVNVVILLPNIVVNRSWPLPKKNHKISTMPCTSEITFLFQTLCRNNHTHTHTHTHSQHFFLFSTHLPISSICHRRFLLHCRRCVCIYENYETRNNKNHHELGLSNCTLDLEISLAEFLTMFTLCLPNTRSVRTHAKKFQTLFQRLLCYGIINSN